MFRLMIALAFLFAASSAALSQNINLEFELFNVEGVPDQMLRLEIEDPNEPVIVTQRSVVEVPGGFVDDAFEDLVIGLLTTPIDEESVRDVERGDRPYVRLLIDTSFDRGELSYRQNLFLHRLPDPAIQMLAMFRPFGPPGDAFVARLEALKAQDSHDATRALAEELEFRDVELKLQQADIDKLEQENEDMARRVMEANLKAQELPAHALVKIRELEEELTKTVFALAKARAEDSRDESLTALKAQLSQLVDEREKADISVTSIGAQLNTALAKVAVTERQLSAAEKQVVKANTELRRLTELPEDLLKVADAIRRGVPVVQDVGDRGVIALPAAALFVGGTGDLTDEGRKIMVDLTAALQRIGPARDWALQIGGHSDATPLGAGSKYTDNWDLSLARSITVARALMESNALSPDRIVASAYGDTQPLTSATDHASLAANRRIELRVAAR